MDGVPTSQCQTEFRENPLNTSNSPKVQHGYPALNLNGSHAFSGNAKKILVVDDNVDAANTLGLCWAWMDSERVVLVALTG